MKQLKTLLFLLLFLLPFICSASDNTVSWEHISLNNVNSATFSNNGKYIAAMTAKRLRIGVFNTDTKKAVSFVNDTCIKKIFKIYFSSNDEILNAVVWNKADGILLKSWNLINKTELTPISIEADTSSNYKEFFVSDKYVVGISEFSLIEIFSASSGKKLNTFNEDEGAYSAFAFAMSNDGRYLAGMIQQSIFIVDLETGKMVKEIFSENSVKQKIQFSKDDKQLFTYHSTVNIYDINSGSYVDECKLEGPLDQVIITPDNKNVICAAEYGFTVMDLATKTKIKDVQYPRKSYFSSASYCPATKTIALSAEFVDLFNIETGDFLATLPEHYFFNSSIMYSGDNKNLFNSYRGNYCVLSRESGEITKQFKGQLYGIAVLPAYNQYYYVKDSKNIMIADVFTGAAVDSGSISEILPELVFSPDKQYLVSMDFLKQGYIIDWTTKEKLYSIDTLDYALFSATGRYILTEENMQLHLMRVRNTKTGEVIFSEPENDFYKSAFTQNEKYLVLYTRDNKIKLFNLETRSYEKEIQDDATQSYNGYYKMSLVKNDNILVYDSKNGVIRFMDLNTGKIKYQIDYFQDQVLSFDVSPDEKYIAVIYWDGSLIQYEIPGGILGIEEEKETAGPGFSISPNPATDRININAPSEPGNNTNIIEIFDQSGKNVTTAAGRSEIDISTLPAGVYYVRMNGRVQKIVKVR